MIRATRTLTTFRIALFTAFFVLIGTATAMAGSDKKDPFKKPRTKLGFGMLLGAQDIGHIDGFAAGMHLELGRQMGPLYLFGEYNMLSVGESSVEIEDPIRGMSHRLGLTARYNFAEVGGGRYTPIKGTFWLEGGLGQQMIRWNEGGKLTRNDVGLGFGAQINFLIGKRSKKPKIMAVHYALRATIAPSPDADKMQEPTCAGPCDEPTAPSPHDLGIFFNFGLEWGR